MGRRMCCCSTYSLSKSIKIYVRNVCPKLKCFNIPTNNIVLLWSFYNLTAPSLRKRSNELRLFFFCITKTDLSSVPNISSITILCRPPSYSHFRLPFKYKIIPYDFIFSLMIKETFRGEDFIFHENTATVN